MTNLYIDPAYSKPMAWAMYDRGELQSWGTFADHDDMHIKIEEADAVYCEDQAPGKPWESIKKLIRATGWVEACALELRVPFYLVNNRTWKAHFGLARKMLKSEEWAIKCDRVNDKLDDDLWRPLRKDEDIVDAILMGEYVEWTLFRAGLESEDLPRKGIVASDAASMFRKPGLNSTTL